MSSSALTNIQNLKASLAKQVDAVEENDVDAIDRAGDLLERLDEAPMTMEMLSATLIGTVVSKFKAHATLGPSAKALVKKWKKIAKGETQSVKVEAAAASKPKKKVERQASLSVVTGAEAEWEGLPNHRQSICRKLYDFLSLSKPALVQSGVNATAVEHLMAPRAAEIEAAIYQTFPDKKAYIEKARSLAFNLKKNTDLTQDVILGSVEAKDLVHMTSEQLASAEAKKARAEEAKKLIDSKRLDWEQANEDKINEMCGIKGDLLKASLFTCGRCKSTKTTSTQKQTRSADEPMTVFVLCLNCGKRWKC